ncbi:MAG TPA: J domain-containing protein [Vulgatibacter sp.]|nr:J domain-containing protein [Vulgatibacter sp.]
MSLQPSGVIEGGTPFRLYFLIAAEKASGCLSIVDANGATFDLCFRRGTPVFARTTSPSLGIGRYLLAQGVLDQDALARAQLLLREKGGDLIEILCQSSGMDPSEAFRHLAGYGRAILVRALAVEAGSFGWRPDVPAPPGSAPLGETWPLAGQAVRRLPGSEIVRRLGGRLYLPILRAGDDRVPISDLGLTTQEARAVTWFDGTRTLAEIAASAQPEEAEAIFRAGFFLAETGLASFAADGADDGGARPPPPPAPPANYEFSSGPAPVFSPTPAATRRHASRPSMPALTEEADPALLRLLEELPKKDHFQVLEVERTASAAEVKKAYFRLARVYHPDTAAGSESARRAKEQITARLNEAYEVLCSDQRRAEYLAELEAGISGGVDVASILEAERLFQQAMLLVKARRFKEAVEELDRAIELDPAEGEFYAWRAFARFSGTADKRSVEKECRAELAKALEASPNCAVPWLFSGRISNVLGDVPGAIEAYKACLALDKNNVEAMRELRMIEARKGK